MNTLEFPTPEVAGSILEKRWDAPLSLSLLIGIQPFMLEGYRLDDLLKAYFGEEAYKREYESFMSEPGSNNYA